MADLHKTITGELAPSYTMVGELGLPFGVQRSYLVDSQGNRVVSSDGEPIAILEIFRE